MIIAAASVTLQNTMEFSNFEIAEFLFEEGWRHWNIRTLVLRDQQEFTFLKDVPSEIITHVIQLELAYTKDQNIRRPLGIKLKKKYM